MSGVRDEAFPALKAADMGLTSTACASREEKRHVRKSIMRVIIGSF
jgi:hypothetical protein